MSRCVLFKFTFILRGDVLAPHSSTLENREGTYCLRVMISEDSSAGSHHILEYCHGL